LLTKIANDLPESPIRESVSYNFVAFQSGIHTIKIIFQLMWFASEVALRKFKFSARGLFPINYELLFTVTKINLTYLKLQPSTSFYFRRLDLLQQIMAILIQAHVVSLRQQQDN